MGDPNQAIYGWNGADPALLGLAARGVPGLEVVHLEHNHRCTPQVVAAAVAALGPVAVGPAPSAAPDGPMPPSPPSTTTGRRPRPWPRDPERAEAGMRWSDQAVLARTHDQLAVVRRALDAAGVPCRIAPAPESADTEAPAPASGRAAARLPRPAGTTAGGGVELATFHRAKGLEWEAVSVVGLEEGFVPIVHADDPGAVAEERRLLYVALTRAARVLDCSWARTRTMGGGRPMERRPSPWLAELVRGRRRGQPTGPAPRAAGRAIRRPAGRTSRADPRS